MTYETSINLVCAAHIAIIVCAFTFLINFSSFSSGFKSWRSDIEETLKSSKRTLAVNLGEKLRPIVENADKTSFDILDATGNLCEKKVSLTDGESYHNALFAFINSDAHEMVRYRTLLLAHKSYSFWAKYLSVTLIILMTVELLIVVAIGYHRILKELIISDTKIIISFTPSVIGIIICLSGVVFLFINHNKGITSRGCND